MKQLLFLALLLFAQQLPAQLTVRVTDVPKNTPLDASIFITGDFQNWNPGDPNFRLDNLGGGQHQIVLDIPAGQVEFKFARGSWDAVEGNANAGYLANREHYFAGGTETLNVEIQSWEGSSTAGSTAADNVYLLDEDFYMPQLDRSRRIWIYLPPDYFSSAKYYPVMYMHDGQNLFDVQTSASGEWQVDESLNQLFGEGNHGCIVVGIENGGGLRINELAPWHNEKYDAGGEGGQYMDFIVETLKPHIDASYRTLPGREYTVVFGSSLGGLISQFGIMQHQNVFSKAGVFSPAFWFNQAIFAHSANTPRTAPLKIYMIAGIPEDGGSVLADVKQMESVLLNNGFPGWDVSKGIHSDGQHSEWYWAREFPWAYLWLFDGVDFTAASAAAARQVQVYPNPADTTLFLENLPKLRKPTVSFISLDGKLVKKEKLSGNSIDVSGLQPGIYVLKIAAKRKFEFSEKVILK